MEKTTIVKMGDTRIKVRWGRLSFCNLLAPVSFDDGEDLRYRTDVLIPKNIDQESLTALKNAINAAIMKGINEKHCFESIEKVKAAQKAGKWHSPKKDGDEKDLDEYKGCYVISPWSKADNPPTIKTKYKETLDLNDPNSAKKIYSGCYANVTIEFFPYKTGSNYGVGALIGNVMTQMEGEPLAGGANADDEFADDFRDADDEETSQPLTAADVETGDDFPW